MGALGAPFDQSSAVQSVRKSLGDDIFNAVTSSIRQSYGWDDALMGQLLLREFVQELRAKFVARAQSSVPDDSPPVRSENQRRDSSPGNLAVKPVSPRVR